MNQNNEPPKIVFEGQEFQRSARSFEVPAPKIVRLVIKYSSGLVKDEKQANYVLFGFVVVIIIISLFLFFGGGSNSSSNNKSTIYQEDLTPTARVTIPEGILKTIPYRNAK